MNMRCEHIWIDVGQLLIVVFCSPNPGKSLNNIEYELSRNVLYVSFRVLDVSSCDFLCTIHSGILLSIFGHMIESISVVTNKMAEPSARGHNHELLLNMGTNLFQQNGAMLHKRCANVIEDILFLICRQPIVVG
jgi:hypothetical protein